MYVTLLVKHRCQSAADAFAACSLHAFPAKRQEVSCVLSSLSLPLCWFAASSSNSWTLELHLNESAVRGILEAALYNYSLTGSFLACYNILRLDLQC